MKTRHESKPGEESKFAPTNILPKIISKELKAESDPKAAEKQNHIFQVERFDEDQNVKITSMIKRFIPTETELAAIAIQNKEMSM